VGLNITPTLPEAMVVDAPQLDPEATLLEVSEAAQPQDPEATMVGEDGNAQPPLDDAEAPPPGDFAAMPMEVEEEAPELQLQLQPYEPYVGKKANSFCGSVTFWYESGFAAILISNERIWILLFSFKTAIQNFSP
jgi:hypothetical protein